jgi:hypothetical protein
MCMVRLFGAVSALLITTTILSLVIRGADWLLPILLTHGFPRWFVPACNLFTVFCLIIAGIRRRRLKLKGHAFSLLNEP